MESQTEMKILADWSDHVSVGRFVAACALEEDNVRMDVSTAALGLVPGSVSPCCFVAREEVVTAGWFLVEEVYSQLASMTGSEAPLAERVRKDGSTVPAGGVIGRLNGSADLLLRGERTSLNLLCRLCGIATLTDRFVRAVEGTGVEILDTRKTTPCLRALEKYAVRMGGGVNHRFDLASMAMLKDNHFAAAGGTGRLKGIMERLRATGIGVEIEVDDLEQLRTALDEAPDRILLDNMTADELREAVGTASGSGVYLEASGGITIENVRKVAETGVDGISSGFLTHSAASADIGLDWERS